MAPSEPAHVALLRYLTASCLLAVYALATRLPLPRWRDMPAFLGLGIVGISFYNVALNTGELTVPAGLASFIVAAAPTFMAHRRWRICRHPRLLRFSTSCR